MVFCGWPGVDFTNQADARVEAHLTLDTHTHAQRVRGGRGWQRGVCGGGRGWANTCRPLAWTEVLCYTCVYVCFKRTLHVMAWRLPRHGSERIHRSCRSRVRSDLLHKSIPFSRTRRSLWGMPTHIHDAQPTHTRAHAGWESIFGSKLPRLEATLTTNATIRSCLQRQQHHVCEPNGR
jgi:hypothetical protein